MKNGKISVKGKKKEQMDINWRRDEGTFFVRRGKKLLIASLNIKTEL